MTFRWLSLSDMCQLLRFLSTVSLFYRQMKKAAGRARSNKLCFLMLLLGFCCILYTKPDPYPKAKGKWKKQDTFCLKDSDIKVLNG